ncbi:MAG: PA0069 family radical SAM protein [Nitrospira sp.]|nr:PA0069 family radical SAM protein [Nitrospira sp.]
MTTRGEGGTIPSVKLVSNPPNRFESTQREALEPSSRVEIQLFEDDTQQILSRNDSPDLPFRWSVNPYRGCFHACAYCYARPSHEYWGFGAGTDFESKIVLKRRAADLLRQAFEKRAWNGELIVFSGNTDCYQPLEGTLGLTRACLEVCAEYRNPVGIITKGALAVRDLDIFRQLHEKAWIRVYFSIAFADDEMARLVEPQAPTISKRFETMRILSEAGISTGISVAPIIPGLNEDAIPALLSRAKAAGAVSATWSLLRLPGSVEAVFLDRMREAFPDRISKMIHRIQEVRGGALSDAEFFSRHHGRGTYWRCLEQLFELGCRRAGFVPDEQPVPQTFRRSQAQQSLFVEEESL